ncbi:MAG: HYR domain-containing protein [Bacteroidota bacterium]
MQKLLHLLSCLCLATSLLGQNAFQISLDRADHTYTVGAFGSLRIQSFESGTASFRIFHDTNLPPIDEDEIDLQPNQNRQILFSLPESGSVVIEVDMNGEQQTLGAVFSPFDIPILAEAPNDFDKFWGEQQALLQAIPMNTQIDFQSRSDRAITYRLSLDNIDGRRIHAYLTIPDSDNDTYAAILSFRSPEAALSTELVTDAIQLTIAIDSSEAVDADNDISIASKNALKYDILAGLRAIDYLQSLDDFDGYLMVEGEGQYGALANMIAGLSEEVDVLLNARPTHAQHQGSRLGRASGFPDYLEGTFTAFPGDQERYERTAEAVNYYDLIHFSDRFEGVTMYTVKYADTLAPAETVLASFNQLSGKKILRHRLDEVENEDWTTAQIQRFLPNDLNPNGKAIGHFIDIRAAEQATINQALTLNGVALYDADTLTENVRWTVTDGAGNVTVDSPTMLQTTVTFDQVGQYELRLLVEDRSSIDTDQTYYTLTDHVQIQVTDNQLDINCPEDVSVVASGDSRQVFWDLPTLASTSCDSRNLSIVQIEGPVLGSELVVGNYDVVYRVSDDCGQEVICQFRVGVLPDTTQTFGINCPEDIYRTVARLGETIIIEWEEPTISVPCEAGFTLRRIQGIPSGSRFTVGFYEIVYELKDECGNEAACTFNIFVDEGSNDRPIFPYPNPTREAIHFPIPTHISTGQLTIMNAFGQMVHQQPIRSVETMMIPTKNWRSGTYFWQMRNASGQIVESGHLVKVK